MLIEIYAKYVMKGLRAIESVPEAIRNDVIAFLNTQNDDLKGGE